MKKTRLLAVLTSSATVSLGLAMGPAVSAHAATSSAIRYGGILHAVDSWVTIPDNFNPLNPGTNNATAAGTGGTLYESLMYDNSYTGELTPMLGTAYAWSNGGATLTLTTRQGVKWSNGKPFSAADVAYTFNLLKRFPALDGTGFWLATGINLASVTATNSDTVVFKFAKPDTAALPFIVEQPIVSQAIWSKVSNPVTFTNTAPVGTGPFVLQSYSPTQVVYKKNPHYWMAGRPYISGVVFTAVKSNDTAELLVLNGDAAQTYDAITDPAATFIAGNPADNHIFWPVTALNFLYFNLTQAPFNDVHFRKAVAEALNDNVIAQRAYYGAIPPGNGPVETGVTNGQDAEWVPSSLSSLEWSYSPTQAAATLTAAGYKDVNGSLENPQGQVLPTFKILVGAGWTDYISIAQSISEELSPLGIHTTIDQEPYSTYAASASGATYNLLVSWSNNNNANPYYEYYDLLDGNNNTDWERYTSATDNAALASFASTTNLATQKADMETIEKDILTNVPVVALTARVNFFDYSSKYFTGWPSTSDPYTAGENLDQFDGAGGQVELNIHLK